MKSTLRTLARDQIAVGMHCFSGSPAIVEAMAAGGLDFIIVDCEHSLNGLTEIAQCVRAAQNFDVDVLVRIARVDCSLGALLDFGIDGVVLSRATATRLQALLRECLYGPAGDRGACPAVRATGYAANQWMDYAARSNEELSIVALIEDVKGTVDADEIAACPQVRALFIGAFDLAAALGVVAEDLRHPALAESVARIAGAARTHRKPLMASVGPDAKPDYLVWLQEQGVRVISNGADVQIIRAAAQRARRLQSLPGISHRARPDAIEADRP